MDLGVGLRGRKVALFLGESEEEPPLELVDMARLRPLRTAFELERRESIAVNLVFSQAKVM